MRLALLSIPILTLAACAATDQSETSALFGFDREAYGEDGLYAVSDLAWRARKERATGAEIDAHADTSGDARYNQRLSERRAHFAAYELIARGLPPQGLVIAPHGERDPAVQTGDGVRAQANRRVRIAPTGRGEAETTDAPWTMPTPLAHDDG